MKTLLASSLWLHFTDSDLEHASHKNYFSTNISNDLLWAVIELKHILSANTSPFSTCILEGGLSEILWHGLGIQAETYITRPSANKPLVQPGLRISIGQMWQP